MDSGRGKRRAYGDHRVPEGTLRRYQEFWVCTGCGKAYWRGSHWKKINETLARAQELLLKTKVS
jgi:uncharacterized protein with PIN domain